MRPIEELTAPSDPESSSECVLLNDPALVILESAVTVTPELSWRYPTQRSSLLFKLTIAVLIVVEPDTPDVSWPIHPLNGMGQAESRRDSATSPSDQTPDATEEVAAFSGPMTLPLLPYVIGPEQRSLHRRDLILGASQFLRL